MTTKVELNSDNQNVASDSPSQLSGADPFENRHGNTSPYSYGYTKHHGFYAEVEHTASATTTTHLALVNGEKIVRMIDHQLHPDGIHGTHKTITTEELSLYGKPNGHVLIQNIDLTNPDNPQNKIVIHKENGMILGSSPKDKNDMDVMIADVSAAAQTACKAEMAAKTSVPTVQ